MSWIIVIATIVTAAATVVLAKITREYVRLTQDILQATNKPKVILFLRHSRYSISLCVQNIGTGYASDVEFGGDLSFAQIRFGRNPVKLEELDLFIVKSIITYTH